MNARERKTRLQQIRLVVLDCDGVLTDGTICINADGSEAKTFHVHDGCGVKYLQRAGLKTAILSGRTAAAVAHRAKELGIKHVLQGYKTKLEGLKELLRKTRLEAEAVCYVGDDLPDLPVLRAVGFGVAVANARAEVRKAADYVTRARGGNGAVRELAEMILKAQAKWGGIMDRYGLETGS